MMDGLSYSGLTVLCVPYSLEAGSGRGELGGNATDGGHAPIPQTLLGNPQSSEEATTLSEEATT